MSISVLNDEIVELDETFLVILSSSNNAVDIVPSSTTITIIDDDMVTIGWSQVSYMFEEDSGSATVCAEIINGEVARPVAVLFTTMDDTTQGN